MALQYNKVHTYTVADPKTQAYRFAIALSEKGWTSTVNPLTDYDYVVIGSDGNGVEFLKKK